jgi:LysM repeat protein
MNISRAAILIALSSTALVGATDTGIAFSGVLTAGGKTRIALTDTAKKTTTWVEPGAEFNGYTVARYDAKEEAVFLKKGGQETRLGLVAAKTPDARPAAGPDPSTSAQATTVAIRSNLRTLAAAARQYQAERGVSTVSYTDLVGPDKPIKELKPVAGEDYSTLNFGPNVTAVSVTTANGATISFEMPPPASAAAVAGANIPAPLPAAPSAATVGVASPAPAPAADAASANIPVEPLPATGRQPASPSYTIQGGDTWQKISEATGVPITQLKQLNPTILEGSPLPSGQTIKVR